MSYDPDFGGPIGAKADEPWVDEALMRRWGWACLVNAIVPFLLGMAVTDSTARVGMLLGVVAVVWFGRSFAGSFLEVVRTVVYGGWVVALTQLVPVLQIVAGMVAVGVVEQIGLGPPRDGSRIAAVDGLVGGFLATVGTGGLLIAAAGMIGLIGRAIVYLIRRAGSGDAQWKNILTPKEA